MIACLIALAALTGLPQDSQPPQDAAPTLEVFAELPQAPGNITLTPGGRVIISLHQHFDGGQQVAEVTGDKKLVPFPNAAWNQPGDDHVHLDSVLGIQSDARGVVWMLDNGLRSHVTPKLVGWDVNTNALHQIIYLPPPVTRENSFVNDLAVDLDRNAIYIPDPAGAQSALIVVDLKTGGARRVLEGHPSVVPEDVDLIVDGTPVGIKQADGTIQRPRVGVDPLVLDGKNEWVYYGSLSGRVFYRIRAADLCNEELSPMQLAAKVERYADKPLSDGSSIDNAGYIYVSDVAHNAIGVVTPERAYETLFQDDKLLSWPDAFSFGPDGFMYVVANQLHRGPVLNGGVDRSHPPYYILRFKPKAPGVVGR